LENLHRQASTSTAQLCSVSEVINDDKLRERCTCQLVGAGKKKLYSLTFEFFAERQVSKSVDENIDFLA
jgi:hypothetical protein